MWLPFFIPWNLPMNIPQTLDEVTTLLEMLAYRAQHTPERAACIYEGEPMTYAQLWERVNRVAAFLMKKGIEPEDRVVLVFPNGLEFFAAFYGGQRAGAIVAPLFPGSGAERILQIVQHSNARAILVPSITPDDDLALYRQAAAAIRAEVYRFDEMMTADQAENYPPVEAEDVAFLQYTSGSTGSSKGVQLSHRNLVANLRQMIAGSEMTDADVIVSWLPVYHDLGLILMTMAPFYLGAKLVLLPTTLTSMGHWLDTIAEHGGTYTAAPDIGYRMVLKQVRDPSKYDISTLRVAINAAEPVRVQTVQNFEETFGIRNVIKPGYGLAEASVGVSFWGLDDKPIKYDDRGFVSIGRPLPDIDLKVVKDGAEVPTGEIGELVFRSPSATRGYFKNPDATEALFWGEDFLHTGDMAYVDADGDYFIVARRKNMIKQGGRSLAPSEIEELVDRIPKVRYAAAVGVDKGGYAGEQAYVFAESRVKADDAPALVREIVQTINDALGFRPGRVYLTKPKTIPFTYNGKIQHVKLKQAYMDGQLFREEKIVYPNY